MGGYIDPRHFPFHSPLDQVQQIPPGRLRAWIGSIDHLIGVKAWLLDQRMSDFLGVFFGPKFWTKEDFHGKIELEIVSM